MKINRNPAALSTLGALQRSTSKSQQSLQRLSTGQKINKAADDASGFAISQKMQAQINGLAQAGQNAQDGVNLVQTAEGAMGNIQDILQKLRTMAVQARNDTQSDTDKGNLQDQADALTDEIGRIAQETTFNTKRILQSYAGEGIFSTGGLNLQVGGRRAVMGWWFGLGKNFKFNLRLNPKKPDHMEAAQILDTLHRRGEKTQMIVDCLLTCCGQKSADEPAPPLIQKVIQDEVRSALQSADRQPNKAKIEPQRPEAISERPPAKEQQEHPVDQVNKNLLLQSMKDFGI